MVRKLRTLLLILALGLSAVSCSGTFRIGMGGTPTPTAPSRTEVHATLQAAVEATLTAAAVPSTSTPSVDLEATVQAAVEATVAARQSGAVPGPSAVLPAPSAVPPSLQYSTYLGGSDSDNVRDLAVDGEGNVYVVETTSSPDLPTTPGAYDGSYNGDLDAFVAKLSSDGSTLLYGTYLGGSGEDRGDAIAVDDEGNVYVTGHTYSTDFPTTPGALDTSLKGGRDVFVAKLSPAGDSLVYSTYLGGDSWDYGHCIAVGDDGSAYVGGFTHGGFPVTPGAAQTTFGGSGDGFVVRLSTDGSSMVYSTYLGGWSWEGIAGIAVDREGNAYLATGTDSSDFPTTPGAYDRVCDNCTTNVSTDAAAVKLSADGSHFIYSTLVGGADPNCGEGFRDIAVDPAGNAYLVGQSCSVDFPTTPGALQKAFHGGQYDAVVTKLNADGSALLYSTYLGGAGTDTGQAIAIDAEGNAYVAGPTDSVDFPTAFPSQPANPGERDAFVVQLNSDASGLLFSTYFGGSGNEFDDPVNTGIGFGFTGGGLYLAAGTSSADLPTTPGAYDLFYNGGGYDGFVARLNPLTGPGVEPVAVSEPVAGPINERTAAPEPTAAPIAEPTVAPPPTAVDLLGQVIAAGSLVVATDPNYAPQSFINDSGELDGFDVEVAKEVARRLDVRLEFVTPDWDMITGGNWGGRWDVSIGSMRPTEGRAQVLWFTDPYYYTPASFAVHKDNTTITKPGDLSGKKVGLGTATTYEAYLGSSLSMMGGEIMYGPPAGIQVILYTTDAEAIQDLALGDGVRLDAVLSAHQIIQSASASGVPIKPVGTPAFYEPLVFALDQSRGASDEMLVRLNGIVRAMHDDGTLPQLSLKWYGIDLTTLIKTGE